MGRQKGSGRPRERTASRSRHCHAEYIGWETRPRLPAVGLGWGQGEEQTVGRGLREGWSLLVGGRRLELSFSRSYHDSSIKRMHGRPKHLLIARPT